MAIDQTFSDVIRSLIREELAAAAPVTDEPDLITIEAAAALCDCDRSIILSLVHNERSGFPAIWLGPRTIRIDRRRLISWLAGGGIRNGVNNQAR
jgi:hypothetical protein